MKLNFVGISLALVIGVGCGGGGAKKPDGAAGTGGHAGAAGSTAGSGGDTGGNTGAAGAGGTAGAIAGSGGGGSGGGGSGGGGSGGGGSGGGGSTGTAGTDGGAADADAATDVASDTSDAATDAPKDTSTDATDAGAGDAAEVHVSPPCTPPAAATDYACMKMVKYTGGTQVVDGYGDEFCNVPPVTFNGGNAPHREGKVGSDPPPNPAPPEEITYRVAWSPDAVHFHAHIVDSTIWPNPDNNISQGDELELYFAGGTNFTVTWPGGTSANAIQIGITPPRGTIAARAQIYKGNQPRPSLDPSQWAVRLVPDGWEVELQVPWAGGLTPAAASSLGFQLALSISTAFDKYREEFASLAVPASVPGTTCPQMHAMPWCDEHAWCNPVAQP